MKNQTLPKRVQQELDQAEAIEKAIAEEQAAAQGKPATEQVTAPEAETLVAEQLPAEPTPAEPEQIQQLTPEEPKGDVWEPKYRALQGKYDTEVPRLHQQNRDLVAQLDALQAQVNVLSETAQASKPENQPEKVSLVTDKDEDEFGSDMIDLQRRVAKEEVGELTKQNQQLSRMVEEMRGTINGLTTSQQRMEGLSFDDRLLKLVPNWQEVDKQQGWLDWLAAIDPLTGVQRQTMLVNAHRAQDADRVAAIFGTYFGTVTPKPDSKSELSNQVTPRKSAPSVLDTGPAQPKIWNSEEIISALDHRKLKHMPPEQIEVLMAEIDAAQREGRVQI